MGKYYKQACHVCGIIDGHTERCHRDYMRVGPINAAQASANIMSMIPGDPEPAPDEATKTQKTCDTCRYPGRWDEGGPVPLNYGYCTAPLPLGVEPPEVCITAEWAIVPAAKHLRGLDCPAWDGGRLTDEGLAVKV